MNFKIRFFSVNKNIFSENVNITVLVQYSWTHGLACTGAPLPNCTTEYSVLPAFLLTYEKREKN
jgi:hypothetical protein